jgi:hypothetical protein
MLRCSIYQSMLKACEVGEAGFTRPPFTGANMNAPSEHGGLTLHVFEQDGGWQWGLTIERLRGTGEKVIAYSDTPFESEAQARTDGMRAYDAARSDAESA